MRLWPGPCPAGFFAGLLAGSLAVATPAQTTHLVGPGSLPEIRDALQIANPGDVVLVQAGTYAHFTAAIGVTIRALVPGTVGVTWQPQFVAPGCLTNPQCLGTEGASVLAPPPGQTLHLVGIDFLPNVWIGPVAVRHCVVATGNVTLDQCSVQATGATALWVLSALLHMQDCLVAANGNQATAHGMIAVNSLVTAIGAAIGGGSSAAVPGDGIWLLDSTLQGSTLQVFGGTNPQGGADVPALRSDAASQVWISDSLLVAANQCAVVANGTTGRIERSTQLPSSTTCPTLPGGALLGIDRPAPPQGGNVFALRFRNVPNSLVAVLVGPDLDRLFAPGIIDQPLSLSLVSYFSGGVYLTDSTGSLVTSWPMPGGAPFVGRPIWFQAVGGLGFPLQVSPIAGGIVR